MRSSIFNVSDFGVIQTYHQENKETSYRLEENIYKSHAQQTTYTQNIKELSKLNNQKANNPVLKMRTGLEQTLHQRLFEDGK